VWQSGAAYERYVGRWSALVAAAFVEWLAVPRDRSWVDVGCGTGALTQAVLGGAAPRSVVGVDRSDGFVAAARERVVDPRASFVTGDAQALPFGAGAFDAAVSGLVLNFVPDPVLAVGELGRVARPGGTVAVYVWDYAGGMELIRWFWDAARELDPGAASLDEGSRFGELCSPGGLCAVFDAAGLQGCGTRAIEVPTAFRDFDDLWLPFLGGQGPAPAYVSALPAARRSDLRELLRARVPTDPDAGIRLTARAWAARGIV
jgi:SAM-dependent methyltransferase